MNTLAGINHIAILTADLDRFVGFYRDVFDVDVVFDEDTPQFRHAILRTSEHSWLHPAEVKGCSHEKGLPTMFDRGHLDHLSLAAASPEAFEQIRSRLVERGAASGAIDDLGPFQSLWFEDPDGMRGEVVLIVDATLEGIHAPRPLVSGAE